MLWVIAELTNTVTKTFINCRFFAVNLGTNIVNRDLIATKLLKKILQLKPILTH